MYKSVIFWCVIVLKVKKRLINREDFISYLNKSFDKHGFFDSWIFKKKLFTNTVGFFQDAPKPLV